MATFVKLGRKRINLDNILFIDELTKGTLTIYYQDIDLVIQGKEAEQLMHLIDVRALGTHVKPVADGE